ncbi:DUF4124 domain-containing protein [uncultured Aquitalea sp.]|uniref:DUF4124 domain-containing protein n=1 Tax=uncultured Aquitalea sp. TaxID=540272 RepID=UPI0025FD448E|nr:DUF4124 domain-containing protein [uncultured Aquitalea sp.]
MKILTGLVCLSLACLAQADGTLYKWVDDAGKVHYSDAPPMQSQKQGVAELSKQGTVKHAAESEQAKRAREASEAVQKQEQQRKLDAARYDKALLESYRNINELKNERERQISTLQASQDAQYARLKTLGIQQLDLQKEVDVSKRTGRPLAAGVTHNLQVIAAEQKDLRAAINAKQAEINQSRQKLNEDIQRYQQLSGKAQ